MTPDLAVARRGGATPTSTRPRDLIGLAERMGIPTEDAVHLVLQHLTDQQLWHHDIEPRRSVRPLSDHDDVDDNSRARLDASAIAAGPPAYTGPWAAAWYARSAKITASKSQAWCSSTMSL